MSLNQAFWQEISLSHSIMLYLQLRQTGMRKDPFLRSPAGKASPGSPGRGQVGKEAVLVSANVEMGRCAKSAKLVFPPRPWRWLRAAKSPGAGWALSTLLPTAV